MNQILPTNKQNQKPKMVIFEYPVQESIRSYLRLESLFKQFQRCLRLSNQDSHFHALKVLFEILEILERGDTRSELIKELARLLNYFQSLKKNPDVDNSKLTHFLQQITQLNQWIYNYQGKFGESIRRDPFIETVKFRTTIPGGSCSFDCPDLHLFLAQPAEKRRNDLSLWLAEIKGVETSIEVILRLIRENAQWVNQTAPLGSFIIEASQQPLKLLRIRKLENEPIFPEFSCGKHRSAIHFMTFNQQHKKSPVKVPVNFELACCH